MNKLSLFSGIGGDDLASEWAGIRTVCFVEIDKFCQQVLRKHWPDIPIIEDVRDVSKEAIEKVMANTEQSHNRSEVECDQAVGAETKRPASGISRPSNAPGLATVDIISGGFPCQPYSIAGQRKGFADKRNLWPEFRRVIGEIKPRWVVAENVPGLFSINAGRFFGEILNDLATLGYSVGWCCYGAVDVGAPHRRGRIFIVAHADSSRSRGGASESKCSAPIQSEVRSGSQTMAYAQSEQGGGRIFREFQSDIGASGQVMADTSQQGLSVRQQPEDRRGTLREEWLPITESSWWAVEPPVGRVAYGVPRRVDRLRALGNAVVPQQIYPIYKAITVIAKEEEAKP